MNFELPPPGPEALYHPPSMTWTELNRLPNIRPFLGWTTYPFVSYEDWMRKYTSEYYPVYNRQPGRSEFELVGFFWTSSESCHSSQHGVINDGAHQGGYVSVDAHTLIMTPTRLRPGKAVSRIIIRGQYHHNADEREWNYYPNPAKAPPPRSSYGFYRSVVDFGKEARGQVWDLFLAMMEPMTRDDLRPGVLILARKNYAFAIPPGYRPRDVEWTAGCECSSLVKVGDYKIPENGCLEFRDKIAHGIPKSAGHFEVLSGAGDGIYPVEIIKDPHGLVSCVKVRFDGQGDVNLDNLGLARSPTAHDTIVSTELYQNALQHVFSETELPSCENNSDESSAPKKRRRKSTSDMLNMTKDFLKDLRSAARGVL
ncbi:hypothetical protein K438DRAFT_1925557 [Mycena galopus ATCC 62051]|nr:hypothetical protein K438DRAFT_1925557 [Mycena galopus ATCC 62051]